MCANRCPAGFYGKYYFLIYFVYDSKEKLNNDLLYSLGKNCEQQCECYNNAKCHHINGECECAAGFVGQKCFDNCPSHTYGFNCTEECKCTFVYDMKNE